MHTSIKGSIPLKRKVYIHFQRVFRLKPTINQLGFSLKYSNLITKSKPHSIVILTGTNKSPKTGYFNSIATVTLRNILLT